MFFVIVTGCFDKQIYFIKYEPQYFYFLFKQLVASLVAMVNTLGHKKNDVFHERLQQKCLSLKNFTQADGTKVASNFEVNLKVILIKIILTNEYSSIFLPFGFLFCLQIGTKQGRITDMQRD